MGWFGTFQSVYRPYRPPAAYIFYRPMPARAAAAPIWTPLAGWPQAQASGFSISGTISMLFYLERTSCAKVSSRTAGLLFWGVRTPRLGGLSAPSKHSSTLWSGRHVRMFRAKA